MVVFHRDRMESHARKTGIWWKSWDIELDQWVGFKGWGFHQEPWCYVMKLMGISGET